MEDQKLLRVSGTTEQFENHCITLNEEFGIKLRSRSLALVHHPSWQFLTAGSKSYNDPDPLQLDSNPQRRRLQLPKAFHESGGFA